MATIQTKLPSHSADVSQLPLRRFTVDEYFAMAEAGILKRKERVELIDGVIVEMAPIGNNHMGTTDLYNMSFAREVGDRAIVRVQGSILLAERSMPEPDLVLLRARQDFYRYQAAVPDDVLLLIEVAESSVNYDRYQKLPRYAQAGIPEVWITVLPERIIEAHSEPVDGVYTRNLIYVPGDTISPSALPDIELAVSDILPE
ncbi:MAG: Uma2 family endonuclease [Chloroflexi bacterium]|nr:Uma2 family endonuclease [Chloroflexota bacterium]